MQIATFAEVLQSKKIEVRKFADLRFAELTCGLPTSASKPPSQYNRILYFQI
jgi:hypothetical protein